MSGDHHRCTDRGVLGCEATFHACLDADLSDSGYNAVHHLVVPAYGLRPGWYPVAAEARPAAFVLGQLDRPPSDHDRRRIRAAADGPARVRARQPRNRHLGWEHHIGDVDRSIADSYGANVRNRATSVATSLVDGGQVARPADVDVLVRRCASRTGPGWGDHRDDT